MAYKDYIVRDLPSAAWALDDEGLLRDYSGNERHADIGLSDVSTFVDPDTGEEIVYSTPVAPTTAAEIVTNSARAISVSNEDDLSLPVPAHFMHGEAPGDFTLEAWFRPVNISGITTVLGHGGHQDGLTFDGEAIRMSLHLASGTVECVYFPSVENKVFYAVGERAQNRIRLFVDGLLVAETFLTDAQITESYLAPPDTTRLTSGYSTDGLSELHVDGLAIYDRALSDLNVSQHYLRGRQIPDHRSVIEYYSGAYWDMTDRQASIARTLTFGPWEDGIRNNVHIVGGTIYPEIDPDGLTYGGNWTYGTILDSAILNGSKIEWDGDGAFTVQVSTDAEQTWTNCTNGREVPGISEGFDTEGTTFSVRILFLTGEPEEETISKVRSLIITLYNNRTIVNNQGNQFVDFNGSATLATAEYDPIDHNALMGASLINSSALITPVNLDADELATIYGVSFWIKPETPEEGDFLLDLRNEWDEDSARMWFEDGVWKATSLEVYTNGILRIPGSDSILTNDWTFVTLSFQEPTTDAFTVASSFERLATLDCRITSLSVYRQPLDSLEVGSIYRSYIGLETAWAMDEQSFGVTDSNLEPLIYAFNWSYIGV